MPSRGLLGHLKDRLTGDDQPKQLDSKLPYPLTEVVRTGTAQAAQAAQEQARAAGRWVWGSDLGNDPNPVPVREQLRSGAHEFVQGWRAFLAGDPPTIEQMRLWPKAARRAYKAAERFTKKERRAYKASLARQGSTMLSAVERAKFDEAQPRDRSGRWATSGGEVDAPEAPGGGSLVPTGGAMSTGPSEAGMRQMEDVMKPFGISPSERGTEEKPWRRAAGQPEADHAVFATAHEGTVVASNQGGNIWVAPLAGDPKALGFGATNIHDQYIGSYTSIAGACNVGWGMPPDEAEQVADEARRAYAGRDKDSASAPDPGPSGRIDREYADLMGAGHMTTEEAVRATAQGDRAKR